MTNMVIIHKERDGYSAEYLGPYSEEINALFGTRVIPTAYRSETNRNSVAAAIQETHPDMDVNLCPCCETEVAHG
jgi:hypothetical protein